MVIDKIMSKEQIKMGSSHTFNEMIKSSGSVLITVKDASGNVISQDKWKNTITTAGKDALAAYLVAASPTTPFMPYIQAGTNGTTLDGAVAVGATSISVVSDILGSASTGSIVLNPGPTTGSPNTDTETVTVSAKSGSGPYTYTISATVNAHASGEPVVMETLVADTKLGVAYGSSATLATQTSSGASWTDTASISPSSNQSFYEFGIFSASTGSGTATMYSHVTTSAYNIASGSSLTIEWTITYS